MCTEHVTNKAASVSHALAILPDCNTATIEFRQQLQAREFDDIAPFSLSVDSPRISPKQVQHAAKCYQFLCNSGHEDPLTTTARMILVGLDCITVMFTVHVSYKFKCESHRMSTCQ